MCARNIDYLHVRTVVCLLSKHCSSHFTDGKSQHLGTPAYTPADNRGKIQNKPLGPPCPDGRPSGPPRKAEPGAPPIPSVSLTLSSHQGKEKLESQETSCCGQTGVSLGIQSEVGAHTKDRNSPRKKELGGKSLSDRRKEKEEHRPSIHPGTRRGRLACCVPCCVCHVHNTPWGW